MTVFNSLGSNYSWREALATEPSANRQAKRLKSDLAKRYNGRAYLTYKGREALMLALETLNLPAGSTVAITGFTCFAVYQAVTAAGLKAAFLDIAPGELNFSAATLVAAIKADDSIKAVIVQNTLGFPADITGIERLCRQSKLALIEDLAHSVGAHYPDGRETGTVGDLVMLSFGRDKIIDAVTGGALIIRNPNLRLKSQNRPPRANVFTQLKDQLYPSLTGLIRATYGIGLGKALHAGFKSVGLLKTSVDSKPLKLRRIPNWAAKLTSRAYNELSTNITHRRQIAAIYSHNLPPQLLLPKLLKAHDSAVHLRYPIITSDRPGLVQTLQAAGIYVSDTWYDAPVAPPRFLSQTSYQTGLCPEADKLSKHVINLPTHRGINPATAEEICKIISQWQALQ